MEFDSPVFGIWSILRPGSHVAVNLGLAAVPVAAAFLAADGVKRDSARHVKVRWHLWAPLVVLWLAFLPNTCYLVTEWRHYLQGLTENPEFLPGHTDAAGVIAFLAVTAFYMLYSGLGMLMFFLAVWPLDRLVRPLLGRWTVAWQAGLFLICAFGVYLGLVGRYESWDPLDPLRLLTIFKTAAGIPYRPALFSVIICFGLVLWLFYAIFDIWMDGAIWRMRRRRSDKEARTCD